MTSSLHWMDIKKDNIILKQKRKEIEDEDETFYFDVSPFLLQQVKDGICSLCVIFITIFYHI